VNPTTIDWPWKPLYTINPVVGCKHNCPYCYARRINNRFKWIPDWTKPQFFPDRMVDPALNSPKSKKIFIGSMCDLFGAWMPNDWIRHVIDCCVKLPWHEFIFLTKNPKRYHDFEFPRNCWLGATVTNGELQGDWNRIIYLKEAHAPGRRFLSIEPILGSFKDVGFPLIDLIIVGADSTRGARKADPEWIKSIKHPNIYLKPNVR